MFHKEGSFSLPGGKKSQDTPLKKSDRRKIRERFLASSFRDIHKDDDMLMRDVEAVLDILFLDFSSDILLRKIKIAGNRVNFYLREPSASSLENESCKKRMNWPYRTIQPILIELMNHPYPPQITKQYGYSQGHLFEKNTNNNSNPVLIPTVATLSILPLETFQRQCIPTITIPSSVSKYLCRGAHLMRPGMHPTHCTLPDPFDGVTYTRGLVVLTVKGNPQPFASGFLTPGTTREALHQNTLTGIGVFIITCYGDDLWRDCMKGHDSTFCRVSDTTMSQASQKFYDGNYGNEGFVDGRIVYAIQDMVITDDNNNNNNNKDYASTIEIDTDNIDSMNALFIADTELPLDSNRVLLESLKTDGVYIEAVSDDNLTEILTHDNDISPQQQDHPHNPPTTTHTEQNHDCILLEAFYSSLLRLKKSDLPMLVSTFYSKHLLQCITPGTNFDLRNTSYKKVGIFLREQAIKGIISLGASKDGMDPQAFLIHVNRGHLDLKSIRSKVVNESPRDDDKIDQKKTLTVVNLYIIPSHFVTVLKIDKDDVSATYAKSEQRRGTGFLTGSECRDILEKYLISNNLIDAEDHECVLMDSGLCDALFKKIMKQAIAKGESFTYPTRFSRRDLHQIWLESLDEAYAIVTLPGSKIITLKRGDAPKVSIEVIARQGNKKFITRVRNVEEYGIDTHEFCQDVSKRFACAGSVDEECSGRESLKRGHVEVIFQGNLADELKALLTGDESSTVHGGARDSIYCVPKSVIQIKLQKGVPKKTKK